MPSASLNFLATPRPLGYLHWGNMYSLADGGECGSSYIVIHHLSESGHPSHGGLGPPMTVQKASILYFGTVVFLDIDAIMMWRFLGLSQ